MSHVQIEFTYDGKPVIVQCEKDKKFKDILKSLKLKPKSEGKTLIYLYNEIRINNDLSFNEIANSEDKTRNKMNILVIESDEKISPSQNNCIIKSNKIICPECQNDIKFDIDDYVIELYECKNKHEKDNIFLDEFDSTQNINISKIICENCRKYNKGNINNNIFYRCISCKMNLCPTCFSNHNKNHNIINYDDKNYICEEHNKTYVSFCEDCKENTCLYCEQKHKEHKIISYGKLIPDKNKLNDLLKQLEEKKDNLNKDIYEIIRKLNKVKENYENYFNINKNIINNFDKEKINYEILYNINNINNLNNKSIINDINNIINDNNIETKLNKLMKIYNKMNSINKISITYDIIKKDENEIPLFWESFVQNNIKNCTMIIDKKEYKLSEKFNIKNYTKDKIIVKLKGIKNITNMSYMFFNNSSISSDISKLDTSHVTHMNYLFNCSSLISLSDISNWNTSNVTNMNGMFNYCCKLLSLPDISKWDTSNVTNMSAMFCSCSSLSSLPDISK